MTDEIINCANLSMEEYDAFLKAKQEPQYYIKNRQVIIQRQPINVDEFQNFSNESMLFDYEKFIVDEAIKRQRYAIFADCGFGKTLMFLSWIKRLLPILQGKKVLIISPLMVLKQTLEEENKFYGVYTIEDIHNKDLETWALSGKSQIAITNFEKFHEIRNLHGNVVAVVLDESSILKNADGKTRTAIIESTRGIPYKLACSATPAPNDREEYANHATFLEYVRSNNEFFSMFFVNRDNGWEIKPHGLEAFYQYLSTWSIFLHDPAKYGFKDNLQNLPKPIFETVPIKWTSQQEDLLQKVHGDSASFKHQLIMLSKGFIKNNNGIIERVPNFKIGTVLQIIANEKGKPTVVWVTYNYEQELYIEAFKVTSLKVAHIDGNTNEEERVQIIQDFRDGKYNVLISKPKLLGFGLNLPFVTVQIFSGLTDSYEQFYQCVRRSHRFGAIESVKVYLPVTDAEQNILSNILRKKNTFEEDSSKQEQYFIQNLQGKLHSFFKLPYIEAEITNEKNVSFAESKNWQLYNEDSIQLLRKMQPESIDFSVFSPPFSNLFTYSNHVADMGNTRDNAEFYLLFEFFLKGLYEVMKKGRLVCCHLSQLAVLKSREGYIGLHDFRGDIIRLFQEHGFIYYGEWCIAKNPQMQAIKEKVRTLSFAQLENNRLGSRPGLNDYILIFKKPGDSDVKVNDVSGPTRDEWIIWACGVWNDIQESDTLNIHGTKSEDDVKHICPMNLEVISRCIRMYSAPNEIVFDPFNGIGSTGVKALQLHRKYIGCELKPEYYNVSVKNLELEELNFGSLKDFLSANEKDSFGLENF